jgi:hypothetical protein
MVDRYQFGLLFESIENRVLQHRRNLLTGKCEGYFSCIKSRGRLKTCVGGPVEIYVKDLQGSAFDTLLTIITAPITLSVHFRLLAASYLPKQVGKYSAFAKSRRTLSHGT